MVVVWELEAVFFLGGLVDGDGVVWCSCWRDCLRGSEFQ